MISEKIDLANNYIIIALQQILESNNIEKNYLIYFFKMNNELFFLEPQNLLVHAY